MAEAGTSGGALAVLGNAQRRVMALPAKKRNSLAMAAMVLVAACAAFAWWEGRTDWKTIYTGLEARDLQQVEQDLSAAGVTYEPTEDGAGVRVPAEFAGKARMEVAAKGMPQSGRMGFELFDKPNWVGSEFDEKVNYQRALEGELEQTIATIGAVRSARVHLALPKESLFAEEREPAKASVVLKLKHGTMPAEQAETIRNLVASAVENLTPERVALSDADGRLKWNAKGEDAQEGDAERALEQKLVAMLEPLAGHDNVRATVNIVYDKSTLERTDDVVDPAQVATLSMSKHEEQSAAAQKAIGVPGTASNTAAGAAAGSVAERAADARAALPVYPAVGGQGAVAHEETGTYAVSRHTTHTETGAARIARITAAVVVNDREVREGAGKNEHSSWKPRTPDEMKRLEELAQAAVGYDSRRGDQVVMQNVSYSGNAAASAVPLASTKAMEQAQDFLRAQPGLLRTVVGGALALLLLMMVVRPAAKQVIVMLKETPALMSGEAVAALPAPLHADAQDETEQVRAGLRSPERARGLARRSHAAIDDEGVLEYVTEHVRRDPAHSRQLLEAWIGAREEA